MSKETVVQPVQVEVKASKVATPVVEKIEPVIAETKAAPKKQVATATAARAVARPKAAKKAVAEKPAKKVVAEKPAVAPKAPAKAAKKAPAAVVEATKVEKASKAKKQAPKKPKLVRDSFSIPETDYALFATLKQRALNAGIEVKKSEILRAALATLAQRGETEFTNAIGQVERIKTGRPKK